MPGDGIMAIPSPRDTALGSRRPSVPLDWFSDVEHRRKLAEELNVTSAQLQDLVDFVRDHVSVAIYGAMSTSGTSSIYNLGASLTQYTDFDTLNVTPKGTTFNTTTDSFQVNANGIYIFYVNFSFNHDESNAGRTFDVRLFNNTDSALITSATVGVGRNTPATNFGYSFMFEVTDTNEDKDLIIQLGNGSTISGTFENFGIGVYSVGELRGTAGDFIDPADPSQ